MEFQARSITIFATAANCSFFFTYSRIFRSLCKNEGNSCGDAYQRERQSRFTLRRNPVGFTFCPIKLFLWLSAPLWFRGFFLGRRSRAFCSFALRLLVCRFLFLFLFRFSRFLRLDWDFVRQHTANVTAAFQDPSGAAAYAPHDPL